MIQCSTIINYKGIDLFVKYNYYPEDGDGVTTPKSCEYCEIKSVTVGDIDILPILSEDQEYELTEIVYRHESNH